MCDVCVAEQALHITSCGKVECPALERGYEIRWSEGARLTLEQADPAMARRMKKWDKLMKVRRPKRWKKKAKMANRVDTATATVFVRAKSRAKGRAAEFKLAWYQLRLQNDPWPKKWTKTKDLAGSMCNYGLDIRWEWVPKLVKDWILRKRRMPSERQLEAYSKKRMPKPLTKLGILRLSKRYERDGYRKLEPGEKMKVGMIYQSIRGTKGTWEKPFKPLKKLELRTVSRK